MTPQNKIKALAELDEGYEDFDNLLILPGEPRVLHGAKKKDDYWHMLKPYLTSYDAIIPLIQKQKQAVKSQIKWLIVFNDGGVAETIFDATPTQLADALLIATGKMKE